MKKLIIYISAILLIGTYIAGCDQFDEYESSEVLAKPTTTLAVSAVQDSSFVLEISSDMPGHLGYVVTRDTSASSIEAISILSLALEGGTGIMDTKLFQLESAGSKTLKISGLMPNSYYKVFAASSNPDGVESEVKSFLVKTNDGIGPSFVSSSPGISNQATVAIGTEIVLTFDEPVKVNPGKKFTFSYYYEGVTAETTLDETHVSGNKVTVPQPHEGHAGDYFFLSWEAGAVTDLSNNPSSERVSGVIGGSLRGNYYRFERMNFSVVDRSISPENELIVAAHDFVVDISFPFKISFATASLTSDMVKFKYSNWLGTKNTEVSASGNCTIVNDTILRITQPHEAAHGDQISLYIAEGVLRDKYSNLSDPSEYEISWTLGDFQVPEAIFPASGSVITSQIFSISVVFDFPISLVTDVAPNALTLTYVEEGGAENTYAAEYSIDPENDSILVIKTPQEVKFGSTVYLNMGENVVQDAEGNVNLELKEPIYWEVPKLAASIDVLIGQFVVSGVSYFDDSVVTDTLTIQLNPDKPNTVVITGIFKSILGQSEPVEGTYDAETSVLSVEEQVIGTGSNRIYTVFSNASDDYAIHTYVLEDGTMKSDMALGVYDGDFGWLGFGEYLPSVTWTKISTKSAATASKASKGVNKVSLKKLPKKIK